MQKSYTAMVPAEDFNHLKDFCSTRYGAISTLDGRCDYAYDRLAKVFDLGDAYVKVFPHDYRGDVVVLEMVAGRMKVGKTFDELLFDILAGLPQPDRLVNLSIEIKGIGPQRRIGIGGIYLGQTTAEAVKSYTAILHTKHLDPLYEHQWIEQANYGLDGIYHCAYYTDINISYTTKDGVIVAITWSSKGAPVEFMYRVHDPHEVTQSGTLYEDTAESATHPNQ